MAKIAIFIDHDIIVRHFLLNHTFSLLDEKHDLVFIFPESSKRVNIDPTTLGIRNFSAIPVSKERTYLCKRLYHASALNRYRHGNDKKVMFSFWRNNLGLRGFYESWFYSWPITYPYYRKKILTRIGRNHPLDQLLSSELPDLIIHPTVLEGIFVTDLIEWGHRNATPTIFIMNSWDNPSLKAMMVGYPDKLVVWGEQTKQHAIKHLGIPEEKIVSLGAAQFDLYKRPPKESPAELKRRLRIPEKKRILLYAGSSKGLNETRHLEVLEKAIEQGLLNDCMVLYRPHPWKYPADNEQSFFDIKWKNIILDPSMEESYRHSLYCHGKKINITNYEDTHVILSAVDAVISPLSTILLEALLHGKPSAAYLPDEDLKRNNFLYVTANMIQFVEFFERTDCLRCESKESLVDTCSRLLELSGDSAFSRKLIKQSEFFIEPSGIPFSESILHLVEDTLACKN